MAKLKKPLLKKAQGGTTVNTQTLSKESEKERQKNNRYNSKYKSSFKTLTSTSNSSGNTTSYSQQKGKNDKIKEKEYFLSKDSTGNAMGQVTKNDKMRIITGKPSENKMKRILKRNTTSSGELLKKGGAVKKMQAGGKIEEQYQKQKKVTSKQAEMDKIKTPYPKTTLKKAQNGAATRDSTKFYQDKLKGLSTTSPRWSAAANIINSNKKDENFAERQKTKYDLLRQYRKGKSGFDANGNPLKKNKTGGVIKKTTKPVAKKVVKLIKKKK